MVTVVRCVTLPTCRDEEDGEGAIDDSAEAWWTQDIGRHRVVEVDRWSVISVATIKGQYIVGVLKQFNG